MPRNYSKQTKIGLSQKPERVQQYSILMATQRLQQPRVSKWTGLRFALHCFIENQETTHSNMSNTSSIHAKNGTCYIVGFSTMLAGCFGEGETFVEEEVVENIWADYILIDNQPHESPRPFTTVDIRTNQSANMSWAVFDASKGGNCCEHYLATTIEGQILNIGGEYPVWSPDKVTNGTHTSQKYCLLSASVSHLFQPIQDKKASVKVV